MGKLARLRLQGCHKKTIVVRRQEEGVTSGELAVLAGLSSSLSKESRSSTQKCSIIRYRTNSRKRKRGSRSKEA